MPRGSFSAAVITGKEPLMRDHREMEMYPKANKIPSIAIRYLSTECKEERRRRTGLLQAPNSKGKSRKGLQEDGCGWSLGGAGEGLQFLLGRGFGKQFLVFICGC